jgi:hypothetical protein
MNKGFLLQYSGVLAPGTLKVAGFSKQFERNLKSRAVSIVSDSRVTQRKFANFRCARKLLFCWEFGGGDRNRTDE